MAIRRVATVSALWLITALFGATVVGAQDDAEQARRQLQQLEQDIARISATQRQREDRRGEVQKNLRDTELRLSGLKTQIGELQVQIDTINRQQAELERRKSALSSAAAAQRDAVAIEVRRAYRDAGDDQLKLLLSQEDPQAVARLLAYYRYVLGARNRLLEKYRNTVTQLGELESELIAGEASLRERRTGLAAQQARLAQQQQQRQTLLATIEGELKTDSALLNARQQDREQLEQLLTEIEAAMAAAMAATAAPQNVQPFSDARGLMSWPVDGAITHTFGLPRNQGKMRWQGVRLRADAGETVSAIHYGRVVYADWLRGSGLLLVIDHGEGYMSLYAHNETLLRDVGDWVNAGAPIGTVGDSGGQSEAGLYFEIRKDGKPTNPQAWCRNQG